MSIFSANIIFCCASVEGIETEGCMFSMTEGQLNVKYMRCSQNDFIFVDFYYWDIMDT